MGKKRPNFALDLSNEGVALWHRRGGGDWSVVGEVPLDAPDLDTRLSALRDAAPGRNRHAAVRIPRSEVLLTKVKVGVFEGDAAINHARKQIADLTPYPLEEVVYDLGDKGFGNMAPVGVVARSTVQEAASFAKSHGFDPVYFTTSYSDREFPREPRFHLGQPPAATGAVSTLAPWAAAIAVGLTAGFIGYSWISAPSEAITTALPKPPAAAAPQTEETTRTESEANVETAAAEVAAEPQPTGRPVDPDTLSNIAPNLPPVVRDLARPPLSGEPEIDPTRFARQAALIPPAMIRLTAVQGEEPIVVPVSTQDKTSALMVAEARRDLPDVSVTEEAALLMQDFLWLPGLEPVEPIPPVVLARLTAPGTATDAALLDALPPLGESRAQVGERATAPAAPPPPPVSLVTADPGTLTPTPEGTLGPGNILIFSGSPDRPPLPNPAVTPEPDPLAGFPPRLRPEGLVPAELLARLNAVPPSDTPPGVSGDDPAQPSAEPEGEDGSVTVAAQDTVDTRAQTPEALAETKPDAPVTAGTPATPQATAPAEEPTLLALADPSLQGVKPRGRPASLNLDVELPLTGILALADPALADPKPRGRPGDLTVLELPEPEPEQVAQAPEQAEDVSRDTPAEEPTLLALADPEMAGFRARVRPETLDIPAELLQAAADPATETIPDAEPTLIALADPALAGERARVRPGNLAVIDVPEQVAPSELLALADPALAGVRARVRPPGLQVVSVDPQAVEPEAPATGIATATRFAVAAAERPRNRPAARIARVVREVQQEQADTKATASTPTTAVGTSKPAPAPTATSVAKAATERTRFSKSRMSLVGVFGTPSARRALVRLPTGRYVKVKAGDRVSGWSVAAIGESSLRIQKGSRNQVLRMP